MRKTFYSKISLRERVPNHNSLSFQWSFISMSLLLGKTTSQLTADSPFILSFLVGVYPHVEILISP